jgi:hypothetical protein
MTIHLAIAVAILFCFLSMVSFAMGLIAWIEVKAMQKSTHSIQYVPAGTDFEKVTKDLETKLNKDLFEAV